MTTQIMAVWEEKASAVKINFPTLGLGSLHTEFI